MTLRRAFSKPVQDAELPRLLADFRAEGYEGLQLKGGQYAPFLDEPKRALDAWGSDPGIYSALIAGGSLDPQGIESLQKTIDFAVGVGAERIVFCHAHPHGVEDEQLREFAGILSEVGTASHARGVALSLHHHVDNPVMLPHDVRVFFDAVDDGAVGLTVDTAHLAKAGVTDIPGFIDEFGSLVDNLHLKDFDGDWQIFGDGDLDLVGTVEALSRVGYEGWLCVDEESSATLDEGFRRSREWLDAHGV